MSTVWYQKQLRILQTVLRANDVVGYDARAAVAYMEQIRANCIVISGGGIIDFFHHELPTANPTPFMTNEDIIADLVAACRPKGIRVMVRVDFRGVERHIYELHPDWFALDAQGEPVRLTGRAIAPSTLLYIPCYNSVYRNEHAFAFMDLLMQRYDIDGIWENSFSQYEMCYCKICETRYQQEVGKALPRGGNIVDAAYDEYRKWKESCANTHLRYARATVKKYGEDKAYCAEIFSLYRDNYRQTSLDLYNVKDNFDFLVSPCFTANNQPLSAPSTLIKFLKGMAPEKTPVVLWGHLGSDGGGWKRYVASPVAETRALLWETVSAGGSFWDVTFNGHHSGDAPDRRTAMLPRDVFRYLETFEDRLTYQQAVADVDVFYSRDTRDTYGTKTRVKDSLFAHVEHGEDHYLSHITGMLQVLRDQHIQYTIRPEYQLTVEGLRDTKILLLPDVACLSDEQVDAIRQFVYHGGKVLATHLTSLFDLDGTQRADFGLKDIFGCTWTGIVKNAAYFGYQTMRGQHPLSAGTAETEFIANDGANLLVRLLPDSNTEAPIYYVPRIYPQSPEYAWLPDVQTDYPTAVVNSYGKGRVIYFPYEIDRNVVAHGHADFSLILTNALNFLLNGEQHITTNAPVSVHISLNQNVGQPNCYLLHLVNYTSLPRRPLPQILPVYDIDIESLLAGVAVKSFEVLYGDAQTRLVKEEAVEEQRVKAHIHVPKLEEYAGIWIETVS